MIKTSDMVSGDSNSAIRATLRHNNGLPFDVSGLEVVIRFRHNNQLPIERNMIQIDSINGVAQYTFLPSELVQGIMYVEFEVRA